MSRLFLAGLVWLGLALVPAISAAQTAFHPIMMIRVEGQVLRVGWVAEPGLGVRTVRVLNPAGRNVFPTTVNVAGRQRLFPYSAYGGGIGLDGRETLVVWRPTMIPPIPGSPVGADWFWWNRPSQRFEWIRTDYSDRPVQDFSWRTVAPLFQRETGFQRGLALANQTARLIRAKDWAGLAKFCPGSSVKGLARQLSGRTATPPDWHAAEHFGWKTRVRLGTITLDLARDGRTIVTIY